MKEFFKKVINKSTLYFTVIVALFSFIVLIANSSEETVSVDPARILWFLPFCICFAIANALMHYKNKGLLIPGYDADIAVFDKHFNVLLTVVNGHIKKNIL